MGMASVHILPTTEYPSGTKALLHLAIHSSYMYNAGWMHMCTFSHTSVMPLYVEGMSMLKE